MIGDYWCRLVMVNDDIGCLVMIGDEIATLGYDPQEVKQFLSENWLQVLRRGLPE